MSEPAQQEWSGRLAALALVFLGGFVVMVLEVYGAYLMRPYFGSSQEVWLAMIGMVMAALSAVLSAAPLALLDGHRRRDDVGSGAYEDDPARAQAVDGRFWGPR